VNRRQAWDAGALRPLHDADEGAEGPDRPAEAAAQQPSEGKGGLKK
jgi:hypothetical protein